MHQRPDLRHGFTRCDPACLAGAVDLVELQESDAARVGHDRDIGLCQHRGRGHPAADRHCAHEGVDDVRHSRGAGVFRRGAAFMATGADAYGDHRALLARQRGDRQVVEHGAVDVQRAVVDFRCVQSWKPQGTGDDFGDGASAVEDGPPCQRSTLTQRNCLGSSSTSIPPKVRSRAPTLRCPRISPLLGTV